MIETAAGRLRFLRERSEFRSAAGFARHVGVPEVTYRAHESGLRGFGETQARQYAAALGARWVWLLTGEGRIEPAAAAEQYYPDLARPPGLSEVDVTDLRPTAAGERDLPVYASAEGGPSGMIVTDEPIDWVRRPEPLLSVRGAFAVYVIGDSMEPRYEQGDMILVHPSRPVQRDDDVLLVAEAEDGGRAALIKRLLAWTGETWSVRQYNPPRDYDLPRSAWQQIYVVVGKYNRR